MIVSKPFKRATLNTAFAALCVAGLGAAVAAPASAAPTPIKPSGEVLLSAGTGRLVNLSSPISDVFVANEAIADVQVRSSTQIYVFGKGNGETSVFATNKAGKVVYSTSVRVGQNLASIDDMLRLAMPEAQIQATPMNGMVLLTGTVAAPSDVEEAERLVQAFVGDEPKIVSRLKTATPLQVMLKVTIAEVSRSLVKQIGVNLQALDTTGGFQFFGARGRDFIDEANSKLLMPDGGGTLGALGNLFGLNVAGAVDLNENSGLVTILAEPTLTALSGETASFLAGGEFPIATSNGIQGTSIEFKQYGVSLAFSPVVLDGGRIAMRVRPEVSELSSDGAITLNNIEIPALTTRRTETTVELGSGQSLMLAGLLRNNGNNAVEKTPLLGDIPILGSLFRSSSFRRNETELVIVVTPYLVKPVHASQIALPTDGFRLSNEPRRVFIDQRNAGRSGEERPVASVAGPRTVSPGIASAVPSAPSQVPQVAPARQADGRPAAASAKPGFSF
ncbi:type II and III secretion system protein family protein [Sphingomonas sp. LY54]|uniref:type II and III secretion system protein family protein n=1 Tax=Sphingomonas sp. LY54 TaxID=3095343 RepID=UPI002D7922C1|nr:type II and III secretion system protein family protein [Sphingomonas sp. LY54]WRP29095.1 type II and III secretion system protein family protein [Sphingomonas sp. LY54]